MVTPIKLTYTNDMKHQDNLWAQERENFDEMERLYKQIIKEAKTKGFNGICHIYFFNNEILCEIFKNEEEKRLAALGQFDDFNTVGYCRPLIKHLEEILNQEG